MKREGKHQLADCGHAVQSGTIRSVLIDWKREPGTTASKHKEPDRKYKYSVKGELIFVHDFTQSIPLCHPILVGYLVYTYILALIELTYLGRLNCI